MRTRLAGSLAAVLTLAACMPSGPYTVVSAPAPEPAPAPTAPPPPPRVVPLEATVVRSDNDRLLVQTNRYAYVALFEIVPGQGVGLLYPTPTGYRNAQLAGLSWVQVAWLMRTPSETRRYSNAGNAPERYVYVLASDRPLRISDASYQASYMRRILGPTAYEANDPYVTARALSRVFVSPTTDEHWGEDLYAVRTAYQRGGPRVARVYCRDGSVFEVREDMADRVWCSSGRRSGAADSPRVADAPDSVLSSGGQRIARRPTPPPASIPIFRLPAESPDDRRGQDGPGAGNNPGAPNAPRTSPNDPRTTPNDPKAPNDPRGSNNGQNHNDNGRRAHGDPANADPRGRGNGYGNGGRDAQQPGVIQQGNQGNQPVERSPLPRLEADSSRKAPGNNGKQTAPANDNNKDKDKDKDNGKDKKEPPKQQSVVNDVMRKTGLKPKSAPDTSSKP